MKKLLALFLMIVLSIPSALAVTEGKIEDAPDVDVSITIENAQTGYYLPDASYFESEYDDAPEWAKSKTYVTTAYNEKGIGRSQIHFRFLIVRCRHIRFAFCPFGRIFIF